MIKMCLCGNKVLNGFFSSIKVILVLLERVSLVEYAKYENSTSECSKVMAKFLPHLDTQTGQK